MKTKYFDKIEFWTRELRLPLFLLSDISGNNSLSFYKNSVIHLYYLNNRNAKSPELGYKFFTKKGNVAKYEKWVKNLLLEINKIKSEYYGVKTSEISKKDLMEKLFSVLDFLSRYGEIYMRTEAVYLEKFTDELKKYDGLLKKLGKRRFVLRKEGEQIFYILLGVLLKEIAKRFKLKVSDLFFYQYRELRELFSGRKVKSETIEKRKKGYALICVKNKNILLTGKKFNELYKDIVLSRPKIDELVGQTAMPGKVRGNTYVILHNKRNISKEVEKFKKGNILVTEMTRPDTILACRKAAAIITDEGGITSHAAIIARELKIPCVIGTKIATQVLKDGDLIEVDASKGIVKIIK